MFENLVNLIKENAGDAIINNAAIPNEHNDSAIQSTASSIMDALKSHVGSNGVEGLTSMISGANIDGGLMDVIKNNVSSSLMQKFGLDSGAAGNIVSSLIPTVMQKFTQQTNDPNNSNFDLQGVIGSLSGGSGIGSVIGKIFG
jgi:uncharacterized protein YidB (DUF937 family)